MILVAMPDHLVDRFFTPELKQRLNGVGAVHYCPPLTEPLSDGVRARLADTEILVTGWGTGQVSDEVLAAAPNLQAIIHTAGTVRRIVTQSCYARDIVVSSQAWANALPVAEYALATILLSARGAFATQMRYRMGRSACDVQTELAGQGSYGRRVGIIGASNIGRKVLDYLKPFDLHPVLADPTLGPSDAAALGVELLTLDELFKTCDIVSLHAPLLDSTRHMIGPEQLALLPDGGTFINTARGAIVDQDALLDELRSGRINAVLDVTDPEVPAHDSALWDLPNLMLTPHIAGSLGNELNRLGESAVAEVERVARGASLAHPVSSSAFDLLA